MTIINTRVTLGVLSLCVFLLLLACGKPEPTPATPTPVPLTAAEILDLSRQQMAQVSALQVGMGVRLEDVEDDIVFVLWFEGSMELPDSAHGTIQLRTMWGGGELEFLMLGGESYLAALGDRSFEHLPPDSSVGDFLGLLRHLRAPVAAEPFSNLVREQDVTLSETQITFFDLEPEQDGPPSETQFYQLTFAPDLTDLEERYPGVKGLSGTLLIHRDSLLPYRLRLSCEGCPPLPFDGGEPVLEYVLGRFDEPVVIPGAQDQPNADDHGDEASVATSLVLGQEVDGTIGLDDDVDFFSFQAEAGRTYAIIAGSSRENFAANPTLYDTDGRSELELYESHGPWALQMLWNAPSTGTYYVAVDGRHGDVGRYVIAVAPLASTPDAVPLDLGQEFAGFIAFFGDVDFFSFQAEGGQTYQLDVGIPGRLDSIVTLYDSDGSDLVRSDDYAGRTLGSQIVWEAPSTGTYYVAVKGYDRDDLGYYTLTAKAAVSLVSVGPVIGMSDPTLSYIEKVKFQLTNASQSGDAVELPDWRTHPAYRGDPYDELFAIFTGPGPFVCNNPVVWSVGWPTGSGPMLGPGETVEITVERLETEVSCSEIVMRIEPTVGVMLMVRVKVPSDLTPVMELTAEVSTPWLSELNQEVPGETVVVEKEVIRTVEVPGETIVVEKEVIKTVEVPGETIVVAPTLAPASAPAPAAPVASSGEGEAPDTEYQNMITAVGTMMVDNRVPALPNPSALASGSGTGGCHTGTNDMTAFPDATSVAGSADKLADPNGAKYTAADKDGYILFGHDRTADGGSTSTRNYIIDVATASFCYQVTADGTMIQYTTAGVQTNP